MSSTKVKAINLVKTRKKIDGENRMIKGEGLEAAAVYRRCNPKEGGGGLE